MVEPIFRRPAVSSCGVNRGHLAVAFIFLLTNIYRLYWRGGRSEGATISNIASLLSSHVGFDEEKCARAIVSAANNTALSYETSMLLSWEQKETATHLIAKLAMDPALSGDYVDVDISSAYNCTEKGVLSLIAAIAQRTAMHEPYCNRSNNGTTHKRAIWFAFREERCVEEIKQMFEGQKFSVIDAHGSLTSTVDVPIHLLVGEVQKTLPGLPAENIALLQITHPPPPSWSGEGSDEGMKSTREVSYSGDLVEKYSLHALFSLYRRVRIGGYVALNGVWAGRQVREFFTDGNHALLSFSTHSTTFMKENTQIRIPPDFRTAEITTSVDPKVFEAWVTLSQWHAETVRNFVGHVGTNPFQTYRYIEAMRHVIRLQKERSENGKEVTVNVCETGFNGGHSAMLFMSFLDKEQGININYFGWDLKVVGSAAPVSDKMAEIFGDNFHLVWGDSKVTLKQAKEYMGSQLCHLIVVDGEHSKNGVVNDLENFLKAGVAAPGAIVFGDDCAPYKRTVPKSEEMLEGWMEFVQTNQLISVANYRNPDLPSPGFVEGLVPPSRPSPIQT